MKDSLQQGANVTRRYDVDEARTIDFMGEDLRVYSTPSMVLDIERSCRDLCVEHVEDGEDTVGAHISVDHLGPTLLGMWVEVKATVTKVEGPRIDLEVEVHDALDQVGRARHVRYAVQTERQKQRLEKKAAKARELG